MIRRHTISTLTDTRFPYTTRFRSDIEILPRPVFLLGLLTATSWTSSTEDRLSAREQKLFAGRQGLLRRRNGSLRIINRRRGRRSEEHTSELQSLMRISYAVFCLKKKKTKNNKRQNTGKYTA